MENSIIIDAFTLLHEFLDYKCRFAGKEAYGKTNLIFEAKRSKNIRKINVLLQAYNLGDIKDFEDGNFIDQREEEDFEIVYNYIEKDFKFDDEPSNISTLTLFIYLLDYRSLFSPILRYHRQVLLSSGILNYLHIKPQQVNKILEHQLASIDHILALIISPEQQKFTLEELIEKYDYPNVTDEFEDIDF